MAKTLEEIFGGKKVTPKTTTRKKSLEDIFGGVKKIEPEIKQLEEPIVAEKPTPQPKEKELFPDVKRIFKERGQKVADIALDERASFFEKALQFTGQAIAAGGDILVEGVKETLKAVTPDEIEDKIKKKGVEFLQSDSGKVALNAIAKGASSYQEWRKKNLRAAKNIEAVFNIAEIVPVLKGGKAFNTFKEGIENVAEKVTKKKIVGEASRDTLDIVKPKLTTKQKAEAIEVGRGQKKGGIKGEISIKESKTDLRVAKAVDEIVDKKNDPFKNIELIDKEIGKVAVGVEEAVKKNNVIFNKKQLRSFLNKTKEDSRVVFGSEKALENNYDSIIDEFVRISNKEKGDLEGLLRARKNFDKVMNQKFPNVFDKIGGDSVRSNAILDVRISANNFIADKLPTGNPFKEKLRLQSDMFTAKKNIANNATSLVDTTRVSRALDTIKKHPAISVVSAAGIGAGISSGSLVGLLTNPIVLGGVLAGGTVKLGKEIVTRKSLRNSLFIFLRNAQRELNQNEKANIQGLIDEIDKDKKQKRLEEIFSR